MVRYTRKQGKTQVGPDGPGSQVHMAAMTESQLAGWLHDQQIAYDAGLLADWQISYLDEGVPGWRSPEARADVQG